MSTGRGARQLSALLVAATIAAPVAQANGKDAGHLDVANLPCTPTCPEDLGAGGDGERVRTIVVEDGRFDWGDAGIGVGAGIGTAAMIAGLAGAFEMRRRHSPA
jgi:hypothetical protein